MAQCAALIAPYALVAEGRLISNIEIMSQTIQQQKKSSITDTTYRGMSRSVRIPSCAVSHSDLRKLYDELSEKAAEALEKHLSFLQKPQNQTPEQFENIKNDARIAGQLTVAVIGAKGEQIVDRSPAPLEETQLPDLVASITFDSGASLDRFNAKLPNRFKLTLDFTEPPGFHTYNPWDQPTPNNSVLEVTADDKTWGTALHSTVMSFFRHRGNRRAWLHNQITFSALNWLVGFPAALWIVYRIDTLGIEALGDMHTALLGAFYVYVVMVALLIFRMIIAGFRWLFPIIEISGSRSNKARAILFGIFSSPIVAIVFDIASTIYTQTDG